MGSSMDPRSTRDTDVFQGYMDALETPESNKTLRSSRKSEVQKIHQGHCGPLGMHGSTKETSTQQG